MAEPKKKEKDGALSVPELISIAKEVMLTHRNALDRQTWYENVQTEVQALSKKLADIEAEDYSKRPGAKLANPNLMKRLDLQDAQEKSEELLHHIPDAKRAFEEAQQTADMFMNTYQKCADKFAAKADAEDLVDMGRDLKQMKLQVEELDAEYKTTYRNIKELRAKLVQIEAADYSKKAGAKVVNPDMWKRLELQETQENLEEVSRRLSWLKTSVDDAKYLTELFRKTFTDSLGTFIKGDKERLKKLKAKYVKEEMQDTLREQRELMGEYNWTFEDKEDGTHQEKGLVLHVRKLLDSKDNRHSSREWSRMCDALSKLHIKEVMDQMWDPTEPLNYDKEQLQDLREKIDEAIRQTGAYVAHKKDTFLVKLGLGKGPEYLKEARESLQALKNIKNCIDTIDIEHVRLVKEADQRYRPALGSHVNDLQNSVSTEPRRSASMNQAKIKRSADSVPKRRKMTH